jgi:hypothetical protein
MHNTAYVALGSNLPHAGATGPALFARAVAAMQSAGLRPRALSGIWQLRHGRKATSQITATPSPN